MVLCGDWLGAQDYRSTKTRTVGNSRLECKHTLVFLPLHHSPYLHFDDDILRLWHKI